MQLTFYALYHNCFLVVELLFETILNAEGSRYSNLFGITFPVHSDKVICYMLFITHIQQTNQAYPLEMVLGHFCNTLHKESLALSQLSMPSLNLFSFGCLTGYMHGLFP
jgi:hypothetical protein